MESGPAEDVFPTEHGDFPASHVSLLEGPADPVGFARRWVCQESVEFDVQADERGRPHATALKPVVGRKPNDWILVAKRLWKCAPCTETTC